MSWVFLWGEKMPIPSPADFRNKTKKHSEVREMLAQFSEGVNANANFNPIKIGNVSLNTLIEVGQYFATDVGPASLENNYPVGGLTGVVHVAKAKNSSLIFQEFRSATGVDYWRSFNGTTWSQWKPKIDLSPYQTLATSFKDGGLLSADINLNDVTAVGRYLLSDGNTIATKELNYPKAGISGVLEVVRNAATSTTLQRFTEWQPTGPITHTRMLRSTWSAWSTIDISSSLKDNGLISGDANLNTAVLPGFYYRNTTAPTNWEELNYPVRTSGNLVVYKSSGSTSVTQVFITTGGDQYTRLRAGSADTAWSAWTKMGLTLNVSNVSKVIGLFDATIDANTLRTETGIYVINNNFDVNISNLPLRTTGFLKIIRGSMSSYTLQEFVVASTGATYSRFWNGTVWSSWINPLDNIAPATGGETLQFTKTATALTWYLPNAGNGTNKIRHTYVRGITPENNRDSWGMSTAAVVSASNATVLNLTTTGVWEVAIVDSQNIADHSGGGHGDEVKSLSYFLVDGIYKPEDFVETFTAKEVKHIQRSTIYVEAQDIPVCIRETTWTFTKEKATSRTRLLFPQVRRINKARISMLPIYRKVGSDGTGPQVTDTETRSQDLTPIDVTVHGFPRRDLPIKDGDSILLSSDISKISAEVIVKKIKAVEPRAYVQNTIAYNKVYVNAFAEDAPPYDTTAGEVWEVETDFIIKVRS